MVLPKYLIIFLIFLDYISFIFIIFLSSHGGCDTKYVLDENQWECFSYEQDLGTVFMCYSLGFYYKILSC